MESSAPAPFSLSQLDQLPPHAAHPAPDEERHPPDHGAPPPPDAKGHITGPKEDRRRPPAVVRGAAEEVAGQAQHQSRQPGRCVSRQEGGIYGSDMGRVTGHQVVAVVVDQHQNGKGAGGRDRIHDAAGRKPRGEERPRRPPPTSPGSSTPTRRLAARRTPPNRSSRLSWSSEHWRPCPVAGR